MRLGPWCVLLVAASCELADNHYRHPDPSPAPSPGTTFTYPTLAFNGNVTTFGSGSIIIPDGASYQDSCGAVSTYGLLYDVLRSESWLSTHGFNPITLHYTFRSGKASPNRCPPTDTSTLPGTGSAANWTDGCDFVISGTQPVKLVTNSSASNPTTDTSFSTVDTTSEGAVHPNYAAISMSTATNAGFLGGPFVIQAGADATTFSKLLDGTIIALDSLGNTIDFTPFENGSGSGGTHHHTHIPPGGNCAIGSTFHVNVYRAQYAFTAEDNKDFASAPPHIALLDQDTHHETNNVVNGILEEYLDDAGLGFTQAQGCPTGSILGSNASLCPLGAGVSGQVFDIFDFDDVGTGKLNGSGSNGKPLYGAFWAPHWDSDATGTSGGNSFEQAMVNHLATFLGSAGTGTVGECASIRSYEGDGGQYPILPVSEWLTCGSGSACPTVIHSNATNGPAPGGQLQNCSDPDAPVGGQCAFFSYPGDAYSQLADYEWNPVGGSVNNFNPSSSGQYRPNAIPLISGVNSLVVADLVSPTAARAMIADDYAAYGYLNSNTSLGQIHYVAGHDQSSNVSGDIYMLSTLLQLGTESVPPVDTEVARATPILGTVNGAPAILQGTEVIASCGSADCTIPPAPTIVVDSDATSFTFPNVIGHMYAIPVGSGGGNVSSSAETFGSATKLFDAAGEIPPAHYGGCSPFTSTCRTVFTTTATGRWPSGGGGAGSAASYTLINSTNRVALATALNTPVGGLGSGALLGTTLDTLLTDVISGHLGGVDHSAVAVVPPSPITVSVTGVSGSIRPTMIYFGAADGMLHAVCAQVGSGNGCDVEGRELWAFLPRVELPLLRFNEQVIEGSPHVADAFGDFYGTGVPSFKTIITFQTGFSPQQGFPFVTAYQSAVYAVDVTDPTQPRVLWEYTMPNPTAPRQFELGEGLTTSMENVSAPNGDLQPLTFVQSNNGNTCTASCGSGSAGGPADVVIALNTVTGAEYWTQPFGYLYSSSINAAGSAGPLPSTAVPGGAVPVDLQGNGTTSIVVFGDIVGDVWEVNPSTGSSVFGSNVPLYQAPASFEPIGAAPGIYATGATTYAAFVTGGYVDFNDNGQTSTLWSGANQYFFSVLLGTPPPTPNAQPPYTIGSPVGDVPIQLQLGTGTTESGKGFGQVAVVDGSLVITTDTGDVNNAQFGVNASGNVQSFTLNSGGGTIAVVGAVSTTGGGGASVASDGTNIYASGGGTIKSLGTGSGAATNIANNNSLKGDRLLFLRTE
jgi:hypothetical protein